MPIYTAKPYVDEQMCQDVVAVLKSGMITQGQKVEELEEKFASYCGSSYAAALSSGTAGLHAALYVAGIGPGDEVITSPFTFVATFNSILMVGAKPVFVDIDYKTFNIDPEALDKAITSKTKAIIPVHLYGLLANMEKISAIAKKYKLIIIEDACQAHGAEFRGKRAGAFGDFGVFSLYATKNMMSGEGGMVISNNSDYIEKIKSFRHQGQSVHERYKYIGFGYNYRMTDIHAVIGLHSLAKLDEFNLKRQRNADLFNEYLKNVEGLETPVSPDQYRHVYHQYTIKIDINKYGRSRDELVEELVKNDIYPGIFYPKPLHLYDIFANLGYKSGDFPVAEDVSMRVLSLPVHPGVTEDEVKKIVSVICEFKK